MSDDRFVFITEWFDTAASLIRTYQMSYYPKDNSIEMVRISEKSRMKTAKTKYGHLWRF